jgi:hypothetical protein
MFRRTIVAGCLIAALGAAIGVDRAGAASELVEAIQIHLYAGETAAAAAAAETEIATHPDNGEARFALGAVQFLQAIEHLGQSFHRYGLMSEPSSMSGLAGLPLFRLPIPLNPNPEKIDYEALRGVLGSFVDDLSKAEKTLAAIESTTIDLPINVALVRLDFDGDGQGSEDEALGAVLVAIGVPLDPQQTGPLLVDFDASDVPWLRAYCNLLMAIAEFPLAHDWRDAFEATFHGLFPSAGLPLDTVPKAPEESYPGFAAIADAVAFIHLLHWPVVEPERMRSVLTHFEAIPPLSRENWKRILAETDNGKEWIPNPRQTGVLPGVTVSQEQVDGWMAFLDEFEALLKGEKLLPHWRFTKGINLRRIFLEPATFDLVLLIQGSAAIPYLEDGGMTTQDTWRRIDGLLAGNFIGFALWFN